MFLNYCHKIKTYNGAHDSKHQIQNKKNPQFTHSFLKLHCIIFLHVMFLCNDVFTIYQNIAVDFDTR